MKTKINTQTYLSLQKLIQHIDSIEPNLNDWERDFIANMDSLFMQYGVDMQVTEKQEEQIDRIYDSLSHKIRKLDNEVKVKPYNKEAMKIL